ncbi:uncharacterized protein [Battus philenor]|uniref:uncharacterized protein n=1 Tax=Battus philenor TaxID=42288 RepID=UPI0035CF7CD3
MEEVIDDNNKVIEDSSGTDENDFSYNFIEIPWDDRTNRSKIFIVLLLVTIFIATIAMVISNFVVHYKHFRIEESFKNEHINCNLIKVDECPYAARIHSVSSQQLICVGAVISENSVLVEETCLKSGPVRLYVGNTVDQRCKKGVSVGAYELIPHEGAASKNLVLFSTHKKISSCSTAIGIGGKINDKSHAFIIGRPFRGDRSLSRQLVALDIPENSTGLQNNLRDDNVICVKYLSRCPVNVGDLLVQDGLLLGLASLNIKRRDNNKIACFSNVDKIKTVLKELAMSFDSNV